MALNLWYSSCHGLLCAGVTSMTSMPGWGPRLLWRFLLASLCLWWDSGVFRAVLHFSFAHACRAASCRGLQLIPSTAPSAVSVPCCPLDSNCVVNPKLLPALTPSLSEDSCLVWVPPTVWWLISTLNLTGHRNISALMRWDFGVHLQRLFQGD